MKVFIVLAGYDYEGKEIERVFSDEAQACNYRNELKLKSDFHTVDIEGYEVMESK